MLYTYALYLCFRTLQDLTPATTGAVAYFVPAALEHALSLSRDPCVVGSPIGRP